ncbi:MAG: EAL domain-containing protein [Sulfuritalea sp.]|nr:EAL domain-containing protein [Sulfuritalea sp.]
MTVPAEANTHSNKFRPGLWPAWIALACSLSLTIFAWRYSQASLERQLRLEFDVEVGQVRADIKARIAGYTQTLRGAAALFAASDNVTRTDWRNYIAGLRLERNYPAIAAVAFARLVSDRELDGLISEVRKSGVSDFDMRPPGHRDRYVLNVFAEPYVGLNVKALGYDMWQDTERRETMQRASDAGEAMITRKITLKVDEQSNPVPAFIMYLPVTRQSGSETYGYVLSPFRMPVLMEELSRRTSRGVSLSIYDGTDVGPDSLFYNSDAKDPTAKPRYVHSEPMMVGGRSWTLSFVSRPELEARGNIHHSRQVLIGGLLSSLLLFSFAWSLAGTRNRALRLARDMTRSMRESEARFRVMVDLAPDAIVVHDFDLGRFVEVNAEAEKLFGCDREELLKAWPERFYPPEQFKGVDIMESLKETQLKALAGEQVLFERTVRNARGETHYCEVRLSRLPSTNRRLIRASFIDISERKQAEDEIRNLAFYDPLTKLPNRRLMLDRLRRALTSSARHGSHGALMLFDLDDFKILNDTKGHDAGDRFLVEVASRMESCIREGDTVARLGGDEFVVILEDLDAEALAAMQAEIVAVKIQAALNQPYALDPGYSADECENHSVHCTASIGIALFRDQSLSVDELMKRADTAMYQAKAAGRNTLRFFDPDMQVVVATRATLNADLRVALGAHQFLLLYQPQLDGEAHVTGAEALVHWRHPRRGLIVPADFIRQAEDSGVILPLGNWVLETACRQLLLWSGQAETAHLTMAVNVSARQIRQKDFVEQVLIVLSETAADPGKLRLEVTESLLLHDVEDAIAKMTLLQAEGISFALDDFGTGYSSLAYLKRLPLSQLKIDHSFVRDILIDSNDAAIARTIIDLGHSLGLSVIAEGVETQEQKEFLANMGCHAYQGYLFGRPGPASEVLRGTKPVI